MQMLLADSRYLRCGPRKVGLYRSMLCPVNPNAPFGYASLPLWAAPGRETGAEKGANAGWDGCGFAVDSQAGDVLAAKVCEPLVERTLQAVAPRFFLGCPFAQFCENVLHVAFPVARGRE